MVFSPRAFVKYGAFDESKEGREGRSSLNRVVSFDPHISTYQHLPQQNCSSFEEGKERVCEENKCKYELESAFCNDGLEEIEVLNRI